MVSTVLNWLMMLFALVSGVAKVIGVQVERHGAEQFAIDYNYIIAMGVLQLLSIPLIYFEYYLAVVFLLGVPYLFIAYLGVTHQQYTLSAFSLVIFFVTAFSWFASDMSWSLNR